MSDIYIPETPKKREEPAFPEILPLLTLNNLVVFPGSVVPIRITHAHERTLIDDAVMTDKFVAVVGMREATEGLPSLEDCYEVGCIGRVVQLQHLPDTSLNVVIQILKRFRIQGLVKREPYLVVRITPEETEAGEAKQTAPLVSTVKRQMTRLIELSPALPEGAAAVLENIEDPAFLVDLIAANLTISSEEKQKILETPKLKKRLDRLMYLLAREIDLLEISNKIQSHVKSSIDKSQREYYLRQQIKAIRAELGEEEEAEGAVGEYRARIEALELKEEVKREALRELNRLSQMNEASAEFHVIQSYLDWIVELPWNTYTEDELDIAHAAQILDDDHYGLEKVKKRILEYLAVRKLRDQAAGPILCFVGPPGVGKTSLGQSIARALGRKFIRMSLGGMRDEAEIRGHRKTYVGALPGRILQNIRKAGSSNPVFMLDEIDKLGADFRGDPSSALLEVLDPAQNDTFTDLYLNVPYDLSKVMFIATGNMLDTIPWALRDRMEVIEIAGYTIEEKLQIAKKYLVPRQLKDHGVPASKLKFTDTALKGIITSYTQEAGVRNLNREIAGAVRGVARLVAEGQEKPVTIKPANLTEFLGNPRIQHDVVERSRVPGVAVGLAWTAMGGDILFIEATRMRGKGNLLLTGQLGEVMKESAQAVLSYIRANQASLDIEEEIFTDYDIHIHVPAGAVPKDGPSAGVTILTAVASLLTQRHVKYRLAMTGEITLRGLVLPVGGIKEKVLAAARAGVKEVILPERNMQDLVDVPETIQKKMTIHGVREMREVLAIALGKKPAS
jgi:ATP-dependent Lon protease